MTQHHDEHGHPITVATSHVHVVTPAPTAAALARVDKKDTIEHMFTYHTPKPGQAERHTQIRDKAKELAHLIADLTPASHEQDHALAHLDTVVMKANAAIARHG